MQQALHICICCFFAILLFRSSQALSGWLGTIGGQPFTGFSKDGSKSQLWLGHSRMFIMSSLRHSCIVLAVCVGWLSCWKVNFQPSLSFWVLWTRFIKDISVFSCIQLSAFSEHFTRPCRWKTPPLHDAVLHRWDGIMQVMIRSAWFPSDMNKELRFIRPENLIIIIFFIVWGLFGCIFVNSNQGFMYLYWGEAWVWSACLQAQIGGVLQWCLSFCKFLPSPYKIMELNQSDYQCLDHLSNQDPSPSIAQSDQEARSTKSPDCFKLYPLRRPNAPVNRIVFCSLPQICLNRILSLSSAGHSFDLMS